MPFVKMIRSLFDLCFECITKNLENEICEDRAKIVNMPNDEVFGISKMCNDSFYQLPADILEKFFRHLLRSEDPSLKKTYRKLLPEYVKHASYLQCLWLYPYFDDFLYFIPKFGKLQRLEMSYTKVGDKCLKLIGTYCKSLRVLNACGCKRVTDVGIQWLCVGNNLEMVKERSGQCKAIVRLNVCLTQVTKEGIKIALKNMPALSAIFHETNIFEVLVELTRTASAQKQSCVPFSVSRLVVSGIFLSSCLRCNAGLTSFMCPFLLKIDMVLEKGLKDIDLQCLASLDMLREINFHSKKGEEREETDITFDGGVAKLLKKIGKSLEKLGLSCFDIVNISTIIELCPNLTFLAIHHTCDSGTRELTEEERNRFRIEWTKKQNMQILAKLAVLYCGYNISSDILQWLLGFPLLKDVRMFFCNSVTDDLLHKAVKHHCFQNLKMLTLLRCHSVSCKGIDALLVDGNLLNQFYFDRCKQLTIKHVADWYKLGCQRNWELYFCIEEAVTNVLAKFGEQRY